MWSGLSTIPRISDLSLPDHLGRVFRFAEHAEGLLVVVFVRGHWCPYCRRYLSKLQTHADEFRSRGADLIAVSPEPPSTSAALARQLGLSFPVLADADGRAIDAFDVRNRFSSSAALLPHPSVFILSPGGRVCFRSVDRNYKKRTTMRAIGRAIDEIVAEPSAARDPPADAADPADPIARGSS